MNQLRKDADLKPDNRQALKHLILPVLLFITGIYWCNFPSTSSLYFLSQISLAIFFLQCFILTHEMGHLSFFRERWLNQGFGHLFSFFSFIPFLSWQSIHQLHHRWTGYRDMDPTTEITEDTEFSFIPRVVINVSWKTWIPIFSIAYRLGNYWNPDKLKRRSSPEKFRTAVWNMVILILFYFLLGISLEGAFLLRILPAYVFSLVLSDIIILSQHSHIVMKRASGEEVKPLRYSDQIPFTRSLYLNRFVERYILLNFNRHEQHHAAPGVPAYLLDAVAIETPNTVTLFSYLKDAKALSGIQFIFRSSTRKIGKTKK